MTVDAPRTNRIQIGWVTRGLRQQIGPRGQGSGPPRPLLAVPFLFLFSGHLLLIASFNGGVRFDESVGDWRSAAVSVSGTQATKLVGGEERKHAALRAHGRATWCSAFARKRSALLSRGRGRERTLAAA